MESIAHSRQPNKVSAALSKKISNGNSGGLSAKSLYDDVYGGPPKFGVTSLSPRFEDYSEIFGSFHTARASSIPVLDLPVVDETEVFFDVRSSAFDYSEVFGGFDGLEFAVSFEDLFYQPNLREGDSSDEAWTPEETDSFSGELNHSGNNQSVLIGDPYHSVDGVTEFNISYHKVNGAINEVMSKGKTHVTQLHAVPGFTLVFDESTPLHRTDPPLQVVDDVNHETNFAMDEVKGKHLRKTMSHPPHRTSGEQTFGNDLNFHDINKRNGSHSSEMFITVSDISLRTQPSQVPPPSRPPPELDAKKGDCSRFHSNSELVASEGTAGDSSPPFFDVEVDMNSSAAAMKEAMDKAEAKIRSVKELKVGKKESSESHKKSDYEVRNYEGKMNERLTRSTSLKDERTQGAYNRRYSKMKIPVVDERHKATKFAPETPDSLEGERLLNMSENTAEEKHIKESRSSQGSDRSTEVGTWKEATDFFELVGTEESGKLFQPANQTKSLVQDTRVHERGRKEREASNLQEEENEKVKVTEANVQMEEFKKKSKATKEANEHDKNIRRSKASNEERRQRENVKKDKVVKISVQEENENRRMADQHGKSEKLVSEGDQSGYSENMSHKQMEGEKSEEVDRLREVQQGVKLKEKEKKLREAEKQKENVKRPKQPEKMKEDENRETDALAPGTAEGEEKMRESLKLEEDDGRLREAFNKDKTDGKEACRRENQKRLKQAEQMQKEKVLQDACKREKIKKILKDDFPKGGDEILLKALEQEENKKRLKEAVELEVNGKILKEAFGQGENVKIANEACERDQNKMTFKEGSDGYENDNRVKEAGGNKGVRIVLNQAPQEERDCRLLKYAQRKEESESPSNQEFDWEVSEILNEDSHPEQSEILKHAGDNEDWKKVKFAKETDEIQKKKGDEKPQEPQSVFIHEANIGKLEKSHTSHLNQEIGKGTIKCKISDKKLEELGADNLQANTKTRAPELVPADVEHSGSQSEKWDDNVTKASDFGFDSEQACIEETNTVSQMEFDPKIQETKIAHEWYESGRNNQHVKVPHNQEESRDQMLSGHANLCGDNRRNTEAAEPATVQEAANAQKSAQQFHIVGQSTERREKNLNETAASEDKDAERMRRERELEKDRLRKIELEREREREREREKDRMAVDKAMLEAEREREREKDRIAVDRATLEARDRAYAEARERAERAAFERATAEARQRALAEARERLEKACAEARDKSFADKASAEARLKAERAAVERATAEARERAMERAKVERTAFEPRERLDRSVSDKFGASSRTGGRQGLSSSDMQDQQFQNFSSSTGSRYPYSSVYGASSFSERTEGGEGESAQRYRARLERYRRTAERAAKALAEKNMRDLLAQKEQAERNRLAETLDAEVRRWSSGKEGNLRALLSTLQYILGPDSGWQPIPLTEVITSAAVKKAYRKATLCVHPDKLQQRGASIQHKYICEKVFDLLKEAWNKFNSEER